MAKMTMVQALNLALQQEMARDDRVVLLGEDVGVDGGVFRVTDGLIDKFGEERVLDTPLADQWTALHFCDYAAFYLAMAYGVDPDPVVMIETLKEEMQAAG